jgi:glucose/arabinose dehydrogenase
VHCVVAEWSVGDTGKPVPSSRREVLRTSHWRDGHNLDTIIFQPGTLNMFLTVGDGGNRSSGPDPYNLGQNTGAALGKLLRVNPLPAGGKPYSVPADNPFVGRAGFLPEIFAYGLRHPQNICFDPGGGGIGLITDIGQARIEEINIVTKEANYGWASREGTFVTDRADEKVLYALPGDDAKYGFTYPVVQYDHHEGKAVAGGYVYRGSAVPALAGHYIFGDIKNGRVFHVPVSSLVQGKQVAPKALTLTKGGKEVTLLGLVGGSSGRVDLRFGQDGSGEVFIMTKQEGVIYKMK